MTSLGLKVGEVGHGLDGAAVMQMGSVAAWSANGLLWEQRVAPGSQEMVCSGELAGIARGKGHETRSSCRARQA